MRPLALVLATVVAVAGAYAVVFWRNASDVRQQMEVEQAARTPEAPQYDDHRRGSSGGPQAQPLADPRPMPPMQPGNAPGRAPETTPPTSPASGVEPNEADLPEPVLDSETMPTPQAGDSGVQEPDQSGEDKQLNYAALERMAIRIGADIQRQMMRGEILRRGRSVGAALLQYSGYAVNGSGEHVTPDGSFVVDVKGPDLIVVTGTSGAFGNQLEMTIIGPREVDRRLRRVR